MRVSMSAIGSVSTASLLPAGLRHARDGALVRVLGQEDAAQAELANDRARPAAPVAARVVADLVLLRPLLLDDEARLRHLVLLPPVAVAAQRQAEGLEERAGGLVGLGARRDRHVEAADLLDVVVVDLRKDDLLAHAERVVAAPVERARVEPAEVPDARQRDRDQPVEELVHAGAAQRDARADGHALADLELRHRLPRTADLRPLAGDGRQLLDRGVELLRVGLRLADAHVERGLLEPRHLHDRAQLELVLQSRPDFPLVLLLQPRRVRLGGRHYLSISWPQSGCLQMRTRTVLSLTVLMWVPTRVGRLQVGQTTIRFDTGIGAGISMMPPGVIAAPPIRLEFCIGRGRRCRLTTLMFSTRTRPVFGNASMTRPCLPRSLPFITATVSPLRIFSVCAITAPPGRARRSS